MENSYLDVYKELQIKTEDSFKNRQMTWIGASQRGYPHGQ